jgi:F-type H+-transporting ATPase subunit gamma
MPSLRDIRNRIRSVKNTQQITKAMKMVAAAKLRRAQETLVAARPYADALDVVLSNLAARSGGELTNPLLVQRPPKRVELVVITHDRGLAGGFNSNAIRRAQRFITENEDSSAIQLSTIGRKGHDFFRKRNVKLRHDYVGVYGRLNYGTAKDIATGLATQFILGDVDAVYLLYNEFLSAISQRVTVAQMLPILPRKTESQGPSNSVDYLYEPDRQAVLDALLPRYLATKLFRALLESNASFQGAQMSAMESATKNAGQMISKYTLVYNRTRQAVITKELMEIVSGAEALK